ncbi:hypothetical protein G4X40_06225 [Rhodococcus sp. D2-41]|nr:hypothetical protein [Rhodococcus sp. D2-41]
MTVDDLEWVLEVNADYYVSIGWDTREGLGGWRIGRGLAVDATYGEAGVWVADTVQTQLAGSEFVQWPSRGWRLLTPSVRDAAPVWVDPDTGAVIAPLGQLCDRETPEW